MLHIILQLWSKQVVSCIVFDGITHANYILYFKIGEFALSWHMYMYHVLTMLYSVNVCFHNCIRVPSTPNCKHHLFILYSMSHGLPGLRIWWEWQPGVSNLCCGIRDGHSSGHPGLHLWVGLNNVYWKTLSQQCKTIRLRNNCWWVQTSLNLWLWGDGPISLAIFNHWVVVEKYIIWSILVTPCYL